MSETDSRYADYQISASESLRAGSAEGMDAATRIAHFQDAAKWARKAFVAASSNVFYRNLALDQYKCAQTQILLAELQYESVVLNVVEAPTK